MILQNVINWIAEVGKWLTPVGLSGLSVYAIVKEIRAIFDRRRHKKQSTTTIELLTQIATSNKSEENSAEIAKLKQENEELKKLVKTESSVMRTQSSVLGEMFSIVFENSSLSPEVKEKLRVLKTKIDCPSESGMLEELLSQNTILREEVEHMKQEKEELKNHKEVKIIKDTSADKVSKKNKVNTIIQ